MVLGHMGILNVPDNLLGICCIDAEMKTKPLLSKESLVNMYFVSTISKILNSVFICKLIRIYHVQYFNICVYMHTLCIY